jgi:hypothetical protein
MRGRHGWHDGMCAVPIKARQSTRELERRHDRGRSSCVGDWSGWIWPSGPWLPQVLVSWWLTRPTDVRREAYRAEVTLGPTVRRASQSHRRGNVSGGFMRYGSQEERLRGFSGNLDDSRVGRREKGKESMQPGNAPSDQIQSLGLCVCRSSVMASCRASVIRV